MKTNNIKKSLLILSLFLLFAVSVYIIIQTGIALTENNEPQEYECKKDLMLSVSRVPIGGGEREYNVSGSWISENQYKQKLKSCSN